MKRLTKNFSSGDRFSVTIGEITVVEVAAAFSILARRNVIPKRIAERAYRRFIDEFHTEYDLAHITSSLILAASELTQKRPLKAYDAVQLATALRANDLLKANDLSLTFVSGDDNLLQAVRAEGLATENPFEHCDLDTAA